MNTDSLISDTERDLRTLSTALTDPHEGECLLCYVYRMLEDGCTGLRWARRYRDLRAPRATALERRLSQKGGYCDCEIFLNSYELAPEHLVPAATHGEDGVAYLTDPSYPDSMPRCRGARRGSTQGCALWVQQPRRW